MGWMDACFADLPDPRTGNALRHSLLEVLTIALIASVCGAESCVDFADFARDREPLFRDFLKLENGLPSHDTFSRLFRLLDPAAFAACFGRFIEALGAHGSGVLAIDGKTLRRSFDRAAQASPLHVVTAFACEARLVVNQVAVPEGGNEITAARALLGMLDLTGMLVTGDAIHCQTETATADRGTRRTVAVRVEGEPSSHAGRSRRTVRRSQGRQLRSPYHRRCRSWPHRDPPALGLP